MMRQSIRIQQYICDQVFDSRNKDYTNPFRHITTRNEEEFKKLYGEIDDIGFVRQTRETTDEYIRKVESML